MGHTCKCGKLYCISHLQAELHSCTYDFRKEGRALLEKQQVVGPLSDKMVDRI
jgi:AN1-type zinc finger and ubiquitin domain-containing protein 1